MLRADQELSGTRIVEQLSSIDRKQWFDGLSFQGESRGWIASPIRTDPSCDRQTGWLATSVLCGSGKTVIERARGLQ